MFCSNCASEIALDDRFCRSCGHALGQERETNVSNSGDGGFNAGQRNVLVGNNISINSQQKPIAQIGRVKVTPLRIGRHPVKVAWVLGSSVLGVIGSAASIWSAWASKYSYGWLLLLGISGTCLLAGISLFRSRFVRLPPLMNLESNKQGHVFITKIEGPCPLCDGTIKLRDVGPKNHKTTILRCTRNPDHWGPFDPTTLSDDEI